jgi:CheY-like chemotaxis protein
MKESPRIVLIEDNQWKRQHIVGAILAWIPDAQIHERHSYQSGLSAALMETWDLIVLDMGLPMYDDGSGRHLPTGGKMILEKLSRDGISHPVLVISSYSASQLSEELRRIYGAKFLGFVSYDPSSSSWKDQLGLVLKKMSPDV